MTHKKYLSEVTKGLIQEFNEFLKSKGISNKEMPFIVKNIQLILDDDIPNGITAADLTTGRKCVKWDSKLVERKDSTTGKKYWQLVEWCVQYEDEK